MEFTSIQITVNIPKYNNKYCDDGINPSCPHLTRYDYGMKVYCNLSGKTIDIKDLMSLKVRRPYGCRCIAKKEEELQNR